MPPPNLHGVRGNLQAVRDLVSGQHPAGSKALVPGAEPLAVSDMLHDAAVKRVARAGPIPARVQQRRDRRVGMLVEELIDQRHDFRVGLTKLPGIERPCERERGGGPTAKTDVRGEAVRRLDHGDILHEQADHAFPFAIGRVRIVPDPREIRRERENPRAGVSIDGHAIGEPLPLVDHLRVGDLLQRAIPVGFQFIRDEAIRGIDVQILAAGEIRLIARPLDRATMQPVGLVEPRLELLLDGQGVVKVSGVTVSSSTRPIA